MNMNSSKNTDSGIKVKLSIYEENYCNGILNLNYGMFTILEESYNNFRNPEVFTMHI